jgi:Bpu10I-like restriction endonuclease
MLTHPGEKIETKDHDFAIGAKIKAVMSCEGSAEQSAFVLEVPAIAIECKTYLDKTMLEGSSMAAEQLRFVHPNALYIVVAEWLIEAQGA